MRGNGVVFYAPCSMDGVSVRDPWRSALGCSLSHAERTPSFERSSSQLRSEGGEA